MPNRRHIAWLGGLALSSVLPGCAIYDPWQVCRYHVDYNTERACSAQIAFYDHLPPKMVRVRLMQWGYNVGPSGPSTATMIPADALLLPPPPPTPGINSTAPAAIPAAPPADLLEQARPPEFQPGDPRGPTATRSPPLIRSGYSMTVNEQSAAKSSRTWLFTGAAK